MRLGWFTLLPLVWRTSFLIVAVCGGRIVPATGGGGRSTLDKKCVLVITLQIKPKWEKDSKRSSGKQRSDTQMGKSTRETSQGTAAKDRSRQKCL
ncbi:hypothetical protein F2Q70_00021064 [Brassica cretica]|uniref:Secreted protein n=1 Tax=Brassica cretica TaxID=69181 RepID=A0A8S9GN61_BRACR|nr:hypothetical protein F2Q70_00021064 [Brassica cretica]KAF3610209.1 hypothetical protein DY000_02047053 [Brassica cretica]